MAARKALFILTLINLLNYVDRWLIAAIMPSIRQEIPMSNTAHGLIISAFILGYMAFSPLFGYLADRFNRINLISIGTALWSIATVFAGFGATAAQIFIARAFVGIGEASTVSTSQAVIADYYPRSKRNQAIAIFTAAIPLGSAMGYLLGGMLEEEFGWRNVFFIAGAPGVLAALLVFLIKEPKRGGLDKPWFADRPVNFRKDILKLIKNKIYMKSVLGYTAFTFTVGGVASWAPYYLVNIKGMGLREANLWFGGVTVVFGIIGTLAGGWGAAYFRKKKRRGDLWFVAMSTLWALPFAVMAFVVDNPYWCLGLLAISEFCLFLAQPSVNVLIMESVSPFMRSTALAFCVFVIHILGDLISPPLVGILADYTSVKMALMILPLPLIIAFFLYWDIYKRSRRGISFVLGDLIKSF